MPKAASNVAYNLFLPLTSKATGALQGTIQHVVTEVLISKFIRWGMGIEDKGFLDLAATHLVSQPFLGGLFFGDNLQPLSGAPGNMTAAMDGAKQSPGVFISAYIISTFGTGLHIPRPSMVDVGMTVIAKAASRLITNNVYSSLSGGMKQATDAHDQMINVQKASSRAVGVADS